MFYAIYIAIIISIAGLIAATYTDLKARIVPNKLNYGLAAAGILLFAAQSIAEASPLPLAYAVIGLSAGFIFGWIMWKAGVFAGGDVKLFMGLGALNAFTPSLINSGPFAQANTPIFPITLFIYSLVAFLPYGLFVLIYRMSTRKKTREEIIKEMKPAVMLAANASFFAAGAYVVLNYLNIGGITATIAIIALLFLWGYFGKNKTIVTIIAVILGAVLGPALLVQGIIAALVISVGLYSIVKLMFSSRKLLAEEVEVKKLQEGMIPAKSLYWKGSKVFEEEELDYKKIILLAQKEGIGALSRIFVPKKEIVSARKARGLVPEEIKTLQKLAAKGLIAKKILIKESMPFVPTMLLGYLLCLVLGDAAVLMIIGAI